MINNKVIFLNQYFYPDTSPTAKLLSDLAFYLASKTYDVSVISGNRFYKGKNNVLPGFDFVKGVKIYRFHNSYFIKKNILIRMFNIFYSYINFVIYLLSIAKRGDIVVVKTDPPLLLIFILPVVWLLGLRQINWLQDLYPDIAQKRRIRFIYFIAPVLRYIRNKVFELSSLNVVVGKSMREILVNEGVPDNKIVLVNNWTDDELINEITRMNNNLINSWNLGSKFIVGYSGNLGLAHEFNTILGAANFLQDRDDIVFLFIGDGALIQALHSEIRIQNLEKQFLFKPYQDRSMLSESLCVADIHWISLPPEMEGLIVPSKFYGICAASRPMIIIGKKSGELSNIVNESRCGETIEVGDSVGLMNIILSLKSSPELREKMGARARRYLDLNYSKVISLGKWESVIVSVTNFNIQ